MGTVKGKMATLSVWTLSSSQLR